MSSSYGQVGQVVTIAYACLTDPAYSTITGIKCDREMAKAMNDLALITHSPRSYTLYVLYVVQSEIAI